MHELAICQSLIDEVGRVAAAHRARGATRVVIAIGPLSGVDCGLLARAFEMARSGTAAAGATLEIEPVPVLVHCPRCGVETRARASALLCGRCGDWRVDLASGDELMLKSVELELETDSPAAPLERNPPVLAALGCDGS